MDDTLDSILAGSDDEAEEDAVVAQVLDEIGIDIERKVPLILQKSILFVFIIVCMLLTSHSLLYLLAA